jgi:hypothetical protein
VPSSEDISKLEASLKQKLEDKGIEDIDTLKEKLLLA